MANKKPLSPVAWVPTLYFAMGLPFIIISLVSVLMFSDFGVSDSLIAFWVSLIMLPWTLKPLWSPFMELYKTKKFFVVLTQMVSGLAFALVALCLPLPNNFAIAIALMGVVAISGASHDIAADGVYLTELTKEEQSKYIGWQGAFYNFAKILANGALVFLAGTLKDFFGAVYAWMIIMFICSALLIFAALYHARVLPTKFQKKSEVKSSAEAMSKLWEVLTSFFQKKYIWIYIGFIILYRFAEGFAMKIVPLFLKASVEKGGLGLSVQDIGIVYGTVGSAAFIIGSILGGYFIASRGLKRSLFILCCIFNIPFVVYFFLAIYQPESIYVIGAAIFGEYFGYGFGFVGLMLFMMQQVAPGKHQMAHYAFASGIMNLGVMIPGLISGYISDSIGYHNFFIVVLIATIPAFLATWFVPFTYPDPEKTTK